VTTDPPFKVGDQLIRGTTKKYRAVVTKVELFPSKTWCVSIRRRSDYNGGNEYRGYFFVIPGISDGDKTFWKLAAVTDLHLDETARLLARAVLDGDTTAALPLADRVMELCGSVVRESQP